jgi:hypothetical protein
MADTKKETIGAYLTGVDHAQQRIADRTIPTLPDGFVVQSLEEVDAKATGPAPYGISIPGRSITGPAGRLLRLLMQPPATCPTTRTDQRPAVIRLFSTAAAPLEFARRILQTGLQGPACAWRSSSFAARGGAAIRGAA